MKRQVWNKHSFTKVGKILEQVFGLAQTWAAILLVNEADVFLAQWTTTNIEPNASICLHFPSDTGVLAGHHNSTTNGLEDFDEAFESCIHISIYYDLSDTQQRITFWMNLFHKWQDSKDSING